MVRPSCAIVPLLEVCTELRTPWRSDRSVPWRPRMEVATPRVVERRSETVLRPRVSAADPRVTRTSEMVSLARPSTSLTWPITETVRACSCSSSERSGLKARSSRSLSEGSTTRPGKTVMSKVGVGRSSPCITRRRVVVGDSRGGARIAAHCTTVAP